MRQAFEALFDLQIARSKNDARVGARLNLARCKAVHRKIERHHIAVEQVQRPDVESGAGQIHAARGFGEYAQEDTPYTRVRE